MIKRSGRWNFPLSFWFVACVFRAFLPYRELAQVPEFPRTRSPGVETLNKLKVLSFWPNLLRYPTREIVRNRPASIDIFMFVFNPSKHASSLTRSMSRWFYTASSYKQCEFLIIRQILRWNILYNERSNASDAFILFIGDLHSTWMHFYS